MDGALEGHGDLPTDGTRGRAPRAGFCAVLPMRSLPRFTPAELLRILNRMIGQTGASAELVPELTRFEQGPGEARVWHRPKVPPRVGVTVAGIVLVVEGQDRPAPGVADAGALSFRSWPAGSREIGRGRAHVRVCEASPALGADLDLNHDRAAALTVVAAAVAELTQPLGVVWETSGVAAPADQLVAAIPALGAGRPPTGLWIGTACEPWGAVATCGLYPLLGAEVELRAPGLSRSAAERLVTRVADRILETGEMPAEGACIEDGPGAAFRVRYRGAEEGAIPAIVLEEAAPGAAGPGDLVAGDLAAGDLAAGAA